MEQCLPLELGNVDIILGVQWLEKHGVVTTNWKTHVIRFQIGGMPMTLVGDPSLDKTQISLKAMIRILNKERNGVLVELNFLEGEA